MDKDKLRERIARRRKHAGREISPQRASRVATSPSQEKGTEAEVDPTEKLQKQVGTLRRQNVTIQRQFGMYCFKLIFKRNERMLMTYAWMHWMETVALQQSAGFPLIRIRLGTAPDYRIMAASDHACRQLGATESHLIGRNFLDTVVAAEDRSWMQLAVNTCGGADSNETVQVRFMHRDGNDGDRTDASTEDASHFPCAVRIEPGHSGDCIEVTQVAETVAGDLDAVPIPVLTVTPAGVVNTANQKACSVLGRSAANMVGEVFVEELVAG